jgi:hypothetical protein
MCCTDDHIGPPPEWHRDHDDASLTDYPRLPGGLHWGQGSAALALALWAAVLGLPAEPGPRPVSTEGGQGRAELAWRHGDDIPSRMWRQLAALDPGGGLGDMLSGYGGRKPLREHPPRT